MNGIYEKARRVLEEANASSSSTDLTAVLTVANKRYFDRTKMEALGMVFPRLTKRSRRSFWMANVRLFSSVLSPKTVEASLRLMVEKNKLYGNKQIYVMGTLGILIRSIDKLERLKNIQAGATSHLLDNESAQDSITDLFNYSILAVLCINKEL